ncbi:MAG: 3-dehydroquinate synthase [Actinomycetota bacterium]|nr:3-dehydroquinate synthase [Actinomycetota bacterium]
MRMVRVDVESSSHNIVIGPGAIARVGDAGEFEMASRAAIVIDDRLTWIGEQVEKRISSFVDVSILSFPSGELSKSVNEAERLINALAQERIGRQDIIVAVGGGVAGDLGGFVASVYMRGIGLIHAPTTLLAQVDSSIGGKTGVDLVHGKNLVGTFYQPLGVYSDTDLLSSLPREQLRSGMAEVIKYALCFGGELATLIRSNQERIMEPDLQMMAEVVHRCVEIKARVVSQDEKEHSMRTVLNYGHTFGHALEALRGFEGLLHGEAISVGMVFAAELSHALGLLDSAGVQAHRDLIGSYGLPVDAEFDPAMMLRYIASDKKRTSKGMRWVLLKDLGEPIVSDEVPTETIEATFVKVLRNRS